MQRFANANLELIQRYEQERNHASHLASKVDLQNATVAALHKKMKVAQEEHLAAMNEMLSAISSNHENSRKCEDDAKRLDRTIGRKMEQVEQVMSQLSQARLHLAKHFCLPLSQSRGVDPDDVLGGGDDSIQRVDWDILLSPRDNDSHTLERRNQSAAAIIGAAGSLSSKKTQRRASVLLLELACKDLAKEREKLHKWDCEGVLYPHEVERLEKALNVQQASIAETVHTMASQTKDPQRTEQLLRERIGSRVDDCAQVERIDRFCTDAKELDGKPQETLSDSLRRYRDESFKRLTSVSVVKLDPSSSREADVFPIIGSSDRSSGLSVAKRWQTSQSQLRATLQRLKEQLKAEESVLREPSLESRAERAHDIAQKAFEESRMVEKTPRDEGRISPAAQRAPATPPPLSAVAARPPTEPLKASNAVKRPSSARERHLSAAIAACGGSALHPRPQNYRLRSHEGLERAVVGRR